MAPFLSGYLAPAENLTAIPGATWSLDARPKVPIYSKGFVPKFTEDDTPPSHHHTIKIVIKATSEPCVSASKKDVIERCAHEAVQLFVHASETNRVSRQLHPPLASKSRPHQFAHQGFL